MREIFAGIAFAQVLTLWWTEELLSIDPLVFTGDSYCIKHQELLTLGLEFDKDGNQLKACGYCEWGEE